MYNFEIYSPRTLEKALKMKNEKGDALKIMAGGTDLLVSVRKGEWTVDQVLNLTHIETLKSIEKDENYLNIGALVTHNEVVRSPIVQETYPTLAENLQYVGSHQIRNLGTVMGNICNASPAADSLPLLYCAEALITVKTLDGEKQVPIDEFITGPKRIEIAENAIATSINIPLVNIHGKDAGYTSLRQRKTIAINKVGAAILFAQNKNHLIEDIKIALSAVAPTVVRPKKAEQLLQGKKPNTELITEAANLAKEATQTISDVRSTKEYRTAMAKVLTKRLLKENLTLE